MAVKNGRSIKHIFGVASVALYAFLAVGSTDGGSGGNSGGDTSSSDNPCASDWRKCDNNGDLVNNYDGMTDAKVQCEMTAENMAKYGEPEFPWIAFGTYLKGNHYIEDGKVVLIEDDAQFQNGFGAMVNSTVRCVYDLRTEQVVDMNIN